MTPYKEQGHLHEFNKHVINATLGKLLPAQTGYKCALFVDDETLTPTPHGIAQSESDRD